MPSLKVNNMLDEILNLLTSNLITCYLLENDETNLKSS